MDERLIIDNRAGIPMTSALAYAAAVVSLGRISEGGKSYCGATVFRDGVVVVAHRNAKSDRLLLYREDE